MFTCHFFFWELTNLQLPLNLRFAFLSEGDLRRVVTPEGFSKAPSQVGVLGG